MSYIVAYLPDRVNFVLFAFAKIPCPTKAGLLGVSSTGITDRHQL